MGAGTTPRARRVEVPTEQLVGDAPHDYADSFEVTVHEADRRSAEDFARAALEAAPPVLRRTILIAHRGLLRFQLGPLTSTDHVLGWRVVGSEPDVIHLEANGPVMRGVIVGRRVDGTALSITSFVFHHRPALGRAAWALAGPVHRRVAPYLVERAAAAAGGQGQRKV